MSESSIHIAVTGISGRLGRAIATEVIRANDLSLVHVDEMNTQQQRVPRLILKIIYT